MKVILTLTLIMFILTTILHKWGVHKTNLAMANEKSCRSFYYDSYNCDSNNPFFFLTKNHRRCNEIYDYCAKIKSNKAKQLLNSDKILRNIVIQSIAKKVNCANSSDDTGYCLAIANRSKQVSKDFTIESIYYQLAMQPTIIDEKAAKILRMAESTTK